MSRWIGRAILYAAGSLLAVAAITYAGDYALLRYRIASGKNALGQVTVTPYFAVQLKNGSVEYDFQPSQSQDCAHSLYPHLGLSPCWYLERHREQRIDIGTPARQSLYRFDDFGGAPGERS
jgi:hypothetical protein